MYINYEIALWVGIIIFYVYHSSKLIYKNEFFLTKGFFLWSYVFPNNLLSLSKKYIYIPNILLPHLIHFQFFYPSKDKKLLAKEAKEIKEFCKILLSLQALTFIQFILLCLVFPLMTLKGIDNYSLLLVVIVNFLFVICELLIFLFFQKKIGLSKRKIYSIFLQNMLCPPFSINLIRELSFIQNIKNQPITMSKKFLNKDKILLFKDAFNNLIDRDLDNAFLSTKDKNELINYKKII